jgi:hypothetical protein
MGIRLYHLVEIIEASENVIETPVEDIALWQRMSIFDARSMLGLYCYRAGYYPAALAQWTRIPERNRVLRPEIARLLSDVDARLAVEKQETQPMKRDEILRQQEVMLSGKVPLADLPNPYEPVGRREISVEDEEDWSSADGEEEERIPTVSLRQDGSETHFHHHPSKAQENGHPQVKLGSSLSPSSSSSPHQNWLRRLRRTSPQK